MLINQFTQIIKTKGLARTNRFLVEFTPPVSFNSTLLLLCDSISIPSSSFATTQNRTFGEFIENPYERLYEAVSTTFYVDQQLKVKQMFDGWMGIIQDPTTRKFNYYKKYVRDIKIYVHNLSDQTVHETTLYEAYPKQVGAIELSNSNKDVMKVNVTFNYRYFTNKVVNSAELKTPVAETLTQNRPFIAQPSPTNANATQLPT